MEEKARKKLGNWIREERQKQKLTQDTFARLMKVSRVTLIHLEKGSLEHPRLSLICKIASILKIYPEDLIQEILEDENLCLGNQKILLSKNQSFAEILEKLKICLI